MCDSRGLEKPEKEADIPRMGEADAREFTKKIKEEAAEAQQQDDIGTSDKIAGLGYKM
jgi:hypothetical protein